MPTKEPSSLRVGPKRLIAIISSVLVLVLLGAVTPASALPRVGAVAVGPQSGSLTTGTGGSASYEVTVTKGDRFSLTANLSVTTALPAGVTASFSPASLVWGSFVPAGGTLTSTLTLTYSGAAPAGSTPFTVRAQRNTDAADFAVSNGTLTILAAGGNPQTINFGPLPDMAVGAPDFTVSASATSGLGVTFVATDDCTVTNALVHLTATSTGSCTITASQDGNATFAPATPVSRTFTILGTGSGIDLYAVSGTTPLANAPGVNKYWGYNTSGAPATQPGGTTITVEQNAVVTVRLHNQLGEATGLLFQGQDMIPDRTGVAPGGTKAYTFTASRPGTYLYEAALLPNAQHQTAMGLYGALIVRPANNPLTTAYGTAASSFEDEAVLVLSEIDPALNNAADPATFDLRNYKPRYFMINGQVYPNTAPIQTAGGRRVLLRYVNAGLQYHSMAVLGARQDVIALDGNPLSHTRTFVAETFGPGQSTDAIVAVPSQTVAGSKLAIYDGSLLLHNSSASGFGGMMTFLAVPGTLPAGAGPITTSVAFATGMLTAHVDDTTTGGDAVTAAEYYVDSTLGAATEMTGPFGTASVDVSATVAVPAGSHTLYVRGRDVLGNWGAFNSVHVNGGDTTGPTTKSATLTPSLIGATAVPVAVHATGDDSTTGGSNIVAAEYFIDVVDPPTSTRGTSMTVNAAATIASLDATIPASVLNGLVGTTHTISIRSQDLPGNWGPLVSVNLAVDTTGPMTSGLMAAPNPNNGLLPINASTPAVRVSATLADTTTGNSNIAGGEAFLCTSTPVNCAVGGNGTGILMGAADGVYDKPSESAYADIPLATIAQLTNGPHTIYVHGRDAAGNWGADSEHDTGHRQESSGGDRPRRGAESDRCRNQRDAVRHGERHGDGRDSGRVVRRAEPWQRQRVSDDGGWNRSVEPERGHRRQQLERGQLHGLRPGT